MGARLAHTPEEEVAGEFHGVKKNGVETARLKEEYLPASGVEPRVEHRG